MTERRNLAAAAVGIVSVSCHCNLNCFAPPVFSSSSLPEISETVNSKKCFTPSVAMPCYIPKAGKKKRYNVLCVDFFLVTWGKNMSSF